MTKPDAPSRVRQPQLSRLLRKLLDDPAGKDATARNRALTSAMLEDALRENASDVHVDPISGGYQLRFRIDGALVDTVLLETEQGRHVLRSFKPITRLPPRWT